MKPKMKTKKKLNQNRTQKRMPSVPKYQGDRAKPWMRLGLSLLILLAFVAIFIFYRAGPGKAIAFGQTSWIAGTIDLNREEAVTFNAPLTGTTRNISINTSLETYDANPQQYEFNFTSLDAHTYTFLILNSVRQVLVRDILNRNGDLTLVYLNTADPIADLEISLLDGKITVKNLHYHSSAFSRITLLALDGRTYGPIIRLNESQTISGLINASSTSPPLIRTNLDNLQLAAAEEHPESNYTQVNFTYTAPARSTAEVLAITATVQAQNTYAHYTFAVGNIIYALDETGFPNMTLSLLTDTTAQLNITFNGNNLLQPLAWPCALDDTVEALFNGTNVDKVYTYQSVGRQAQVWSQTAPVNELTEFDAFSGYYIKLKEAAETKISTTCTVQNLKSPLLPSFSEEVQSQLLSEGWNLLSLPGITPAFLTEFIAETNFTVYECQEGYLCAPYEGPLNPGKPYWVKSPRVNLQYILE